VVAASDSENAAFFEPKILAFLCNWCSYSGADSAGKSKIKYAANINVIRVMCSGRIDPTFILRAFHSGMDGVLVCGCHLGDCHYLEGNCKALGRHLLLQSVLKDIGIEPQRLRLEWVSATEGTRYAQIVNEMTEQIRQLGPLNFPVIKSEHSENHQLQDV